MKVDPTQIDAVETIELIGSTVPESVHNGEPVMIGIDEAGRGPVLGPMVYGAAYWPIADDAELSAMGFDDSKALSAEAREGLFAKMQSLTTSRLGYVIRVISAAEISDQMQKQTSNLNEISRHAAIQLIQQIQQRGVNVTHVYVDTVGDPTWYEQFLTTHFHNTLTFCVRKKADSLFKVVSAASIAAKVTRDRAVTTWQWETPALTTKATEQGVEIGSGYPSDPRTKVWLEKNVDPVFAYPNIVRFSWGTITPLLEKHTVPVDWPFERELEKANNGEALANTPSITSFFQTTTGSATKKAKQPVVPRASYFQQRRLHLVSDF